MNAVNYSSIRNNLKTYCDLAYEKQDDIIITRKEEKNVVLLSLEKYNQIMKAARNAEYLSGIDRSLEQLSQGRGQKHDLIEVDDE